MKNTKGQSSPVPTRFAALAADVAILTLRDDELLVRLMRVDRPPFFDGVPGLPGGLIQPDETAEQTARRLIQEKGGIQASNTYSEQLATFSEIDRDPRNRVVAVAYTAYIPWEKLSATERANTELYWWANVRQVKQLAYDHMHILRTAIDRTRARIGYTTLIAKILPTEFTLTQLEQGFETILGRELDKRNFRKKFDKLSLLEDTGHKTSGDRWRPARLYRFKSKTVDQIEIL